MPRRVITKPGPKSRKKETSTLTSKNLKSFLGDADSTNDSESSTESESFQSADLDEQTDYGLDFTSNRPRSTYRSSVHGSYKRQKDSTLNLSSSRTRNVTRNHAKGSPLGRQPIPTQIKKPRKPLNPVRRDGLFWKNVGALQARTDNVTPRAPFARLIREILQNESTSANRLTLTALNALQESAEMYLTSLFQDSYCCTLHRGRVTLNVKDMELVRFLRGRPDPGNR